MASRIIVSFLPHNTYCHSLALGVCCVSATLLLKPYTYVTVYYLVVHHGFVGRDARKLDICCGKPFDMFAYALLGPLSGLE
ncbi:MAG: hypothetical protein V4649_19450 [Bacteroidota bacterium]